MNFILDGKFTNSSAGKFKNKMHVNKHLLVLKSPMFHHARKILRSRQNLVGWNSVFEWNQKANYSPVFSKYWASLSRSFMLDFVNRMNWSSTLPNIVGFV